MPIGVPRIIYCWGEELPAQWTDIYNFIFRRRMVFLMQYLDDELCNQICGLLINIHMEDRSKELEKKEMERSGLFKTSGGDMKGKSSSAPGASASAFGGTQNLNPNRKEKSMDDLLISDEDLGIEENDTLEQYTLQKITMEWLNWNAQFFDYSEEPYLFYLAELLSKDLSKNDAQNLYSNTSNNSSSLNNKEISRLMMMFKNMTNLMNNKNSSLNTSGNLGMQKNSDFNSISGSTSDGKLRHFDVYSPFRSVSNFASGDYSLNDLNPLMNNPKLLSLFKNLNASQKNNSYGSLVSELSDRNLSQKLANSNQLEYTSEKALGQRNLRKQYIRDGFLNNSSATQTFGDPNKYYSYLEGTNSSDSYNEFRDYYRKQTEKALIEEESKKVFVIINSFGGSVGNGITVHDALQFIKAGSLTLGLGVAASAASLALAGGTIGERYVTEGCHVMIHQPESGLQGQASDIWIDSQEIMKIRLDVAEIYSLSTYRPKHKILRDLDRDFYLTATETIYYGLADEIATNEVLHEIIEMTSKVWDYHDSKQQRLLETRESASSGLDTQTQN
uniref:ATP-dependent Clp protease proteolytic subunit n=1 Tax=Phacotus lenticularis TaxID=52965 RepID=A0A0S2LR22_9CHLO|nr:proteolytic subunit 2 of clp protease [Phacotus lenticularis]ALO63576.1 proteolytic subunit 2 of clp protease [Phacotus lenticularis]